MHLKLAVLLLALALCGPADALVLAGTVADLEGVANAISKAGLERPLQVGSTVLEGDQVSTATGARLLLRMTDGATLALGHNAKLSVAAYDRDAQPARAVLALDCGALMLRTGAIARSARDAFILTTPLAVLGVQGAEVWASQAADRLELALLSGESVRVTTEQGSVDLTEAATGVLIIPGEAPPEPSPWDAQRIEAARQDVAAR